MSKVVNRRQRGGTGKRLTVPVAGTRTAAKKQPATSAARKRRSRYASGGFDAAAEFSVAEAQWADVAPGLPDEQACWLAPPIVVSVRATT